MKTLVLFTLMLLALGDKAFSQAREHYVYIDGSNLADDVMTPTKVSFIQGSRKQTKRGTPTWGMLEANNGDSVISAGPMKQISRGDTLSIYLVKGHKVALPTKAYPSIGNIVNTRKGKPIEALAMEFEKCACTKETGIMFGRDSITTNTYPPYKMLIEFPVDSAKWSIAGSGNGRYLVPGVLANLINSLDTSRNAPYGLAAVSKDGATCDIVWLQADDYEGTVKTQIYFGNLKEEGKRFDFVDGQYTFEHDQVLTFKLLTRAPAEEVGGVEDRPHDKRERKKRTSRPGRTPVF
jgi:hypothetical protein